MSYSTDYRKRTIEYREEGHTLEETHEIFKVAISMIRTWEKQRMAYVEEHPGSYPEEIAKEFKCCETAIRNAFKRLHITRKKRHTIGNKTQKK